MILLVCKAICTVAVCVDHVADLVLDEFKRRREIDRAWKAAVQAHRDYVARERTIRAVVNAHLRESERRRVQS